MKTHLTLSATSLAAIQTAPGTPGEILADTTNVIAVSSSASDTQIAGIVGFDTTPVTPVGQLENLTLTGQIEVETLDTWSSITRIGLAAVAAGGIQFRRQGTAAGGLLTVGTIPTEGETLIAGLNGNEVTYTFRAPGRLTVQCPTVANLNSSGTASYLTFTLNGANVSFWFSVGTAADPGAGIGTRFMVDLITGAPTTAAQVATALRNSIGSNYPGVIGTISTDTVTVTGLNLGTLSVIQSDVGSSFTLTTVAAGTTLAANQIRRAYHTDGAVVTTTNIADNISKALNRNGTHGNEYSSATTRHPEISASPSTNTVILTDRIACDRYLGWADLAGTAITSSGNITATTQMTGGANGVLICEIAPGQAGAGSTITLDDTVTTNLPAGFVTVFDAIQVHGRQACLYVVSDATFDVDGRFTIRGGPTTDKMVDLDVDLPSTGTALMRSSILEGCEYIQVELTDNPNGGAVWAALVY